MSTSSAAGFYRRLFGREGPCSIRESRRGSCREGRAGVAGLTLKALAQGVQGNAPLVNILIPREGRVVLEIAPA